jgi:ABC-type multidrug transport system permease subunit
MEAFITAAGDGLVLNPDAREACQFCSVTSTNFFMRMLNLNFNNRWRDFGLMWVYIIFNVFGAMGLYWLARVPKGAKTEGSKAVPLTPTAPEKRRESLVR